MTSSFIRLLTTDDYDQWRGLYQGYADFYQVALTKNGVQTTWLIDARQVCTGLVAELGAEGWHCAFSPHAKCFTRANNWVFG